MFVKYSMLLKYRYKTFLTQEKINSWIENKSEERISIFKIRRYKTKITEDGFRIRKRRFNEYQAFYPQIIGKFDNDNRIIKIKIQPSIMGMLFFGIFWFVVPIMILTLEKATVNGTLRTLDFADRLNGIGILLLILIPMTLIFLIWPNFKARKWIENELKLTERQKMAAANNV